MSTHIRKARGRNGQVLMMMTMLLIPMLGIIGLVTDFGYMHFAKMSAQTAAEAAAQSAIVDFHAHAGGAISGCGTGTGHTYVNCVSTQTWCPHISSISTTSYATDVGCLYAQQHGFDSSSSGFVSNTAGIGKTAVSYEAGYGAVAPTTPGTGTATYWVTYWVYQKVPQLFSAVMGNTTGLLVARSTAALMGATDCIYAMNKTLAGAITISGTAQITSSCGVFDNSSASGQNSSAAMVLNGCGNGTGLSAPEYDIVGSYSGGNCTLSPTPNLGVDHQNDPLSSLPAPASATYTCDYTNFSTGQSASDVYLSPGVYCGGIQLGSNQTYHFSAGTYILVGGAQHNSAFYASSNSTVDGGTGVTFYLTYGAANTSGGLVNYTYAPVNINAGTVVTLKAPTTGTYAGILFFEDRGVTSTTEDYGGNSTAIYEGIIYALHSALTMHGTSSTGAKYTGIVADTINMVGTSTFNADYSSLPNGSPLQKIWMLE